MPELSDYPPLSQEASEALQEFMSLFFERASEQEIRAARLRFSEIRERDKQRAQEAQQQEGSAGNAG